MTNAPRYKALFDGKNFFQIKIQQKNFFPLSFTFYEIFFFGQIR